MSSFRSEIAELEGAMQSGSPGRRTEVLRRITDLFASKNELLSEQQVTLFDDILNCLVVQLEKEALTELSQRLAPAKKAPPRMIKMLGTHDAIEVAGPILENSEQLSDADLIEIARTKGQEHQLKIATRSQLAEAVTEALIDRGDSEVVYTVAKNEGAHFSNSGFTKLAGLANGDDRLTATVASRSDVPPRIFREILSRASDTVKKRLLATSSPQKRDALKKVLSEVSGKLGTRVTVKHYAKAQKLLHSFGQDRVLIRRKLQEFAEAELLDETVASLSALTAVPIECVDQLFYGSEAYGVMVLCRLMALEWTITSAVLLSRPGVQEGASLDLASLEQDYRAIDPQTAQRLVRFWQTQQNSPAAARRH